MSQTLIRGTLILFGAGLFNRIVGFFYRIILSRQLGAQGMGLLAMVQPILFLTVTLCSAGLQIALSKIIAERAAVRPGTIKVVMRVALVMALVTSIPLTLVLFFSSNSLVHHLVSDPRASLPLMLMAPLVFIIALATVYRGYFMGLQRMGPTAVSQIIENLVRIVLVVALLPHFVRLGLAWGAAGAAIALVLGEVAGLIVLWVCMRIGPNPMRDAPTVDSPGEVRQTLWEILDVSLPVTLTRVVGALSDVADASFIPRRLMQFGLSRDKATAFLGALSGMAMPLLFFPTVITFALAQALVPAVSEAFAQGDLDLVRRRTEQSLHISLLVSLPASAVFLILGPQLGLLFYNQVEVGTLIRQLAFAAPFLYLEATISSVLRGVGLANVSMRNGLVGSAFRVAFIYFLTARPGFGPRSVIVGISLDLAISFWFNYVSLKRAIHIRALLGQWLVRPALAALLMVFSLSPIQGAFASLGAGPWVALLSSVLFGLGIYALALTALGTRLRSL